MFVLQYHNVVIRPRGIHRTPQRFNSTGEIRPYNNVCNLKIQHTNSKLCRLCIRYKIPELIRDNYFPKIVLEKCTPSLMQDSLNIPKHILLGNIKQHVQFEIAMYAKKSPMGLYNCLSDFLSIEHHASSVYFGRFSVVVCNLFYHI